MCRFKSYQCSFINIYSVGRSHKWFLNEVKFAPVKNGYTVRKDEYLFLFLQRIGFGLKTQYLETSGKTLDSWERPQYTAILREKGHSFLLVGF